MTIGQRERIVYRVVERVGRSRSFLPAFGVGSGLDDPALGVTLNRVVKGPSKFRTTHRTVIGLVVAEDEDHVTIERDDGEQSRIPTSDIIKRTAVA